MSVSEDPTRAGEANGRWWLVLSAPAPPRGQELLLVDALRRVGARAVERRGDRFEALLPPPGPEASVSALVAEATAAVRASTSLTDPDVRCRRVPHDEWADGWRRGQRAVRVTDRIIVAPAAGTPLAEEGVGEEGVAEAGVGDAGSGARVVRLEATVAFGTAEHPTTRACLRVLDRRVRAGDRILDVGAGSGILAIAAAVLGADRVVAVEADPASCAAARRNAALNDVADRVDVRAGEARPGDLRATGRFDGIVANLEAAILAPLAPGLAGAVRRGGWVAVSGVIRAERDATVAALRQAGLALEAEEREAGWWTGVFVRAGKRDRPPATR